MEAEFLGERSSSDKAPLSIFTYAQLYSNCIWFHHSIKLDSFRTLIGNDGLFYKEYEELTDISI